MRYLTGAHLIEESLEIGLSTGTMPPTFLRPQLPRSARLDLETTQTFPFENLTLMLADRTASWCLLDDFERSVAESAREGTTLGELPHRYPQLSETTLTDFFVRLYQRGLLKVNGRPGVNPDLLASGALFREGYLVEVLVTQKCNLACPYCLAEAGPEMPHMHPELAYLAVDEAFKLPSDFPLAIQLSGGEPFVNFRLFRDLVLRIEAKQQETGRRVTVVTQSNGTLITDEIAEFLKAHKVQIGVSIDGPAHLNDRSRPLLGGGSSYYRAIKGIRTLLRHGITFGTIVVLNQTNYQAAPEIADFLVGLGVRSTKINPISQIGDARQTWDTMAISADNYFNFVTTWINHVLDNRLPIRDENLGEYLKYMSRRSHNYRCMRSNCGAGQSFFLVDSKGDVYPCAHSAGVPQWRIGSIADSRGDLVQLGKRNSIVQEFHGRLVEQMPGPRSCPWRHFCEGGCAVNAYQRYGSIMAPDVLCEFYERIYPYLFAMLAAQPMRFQTLLDVAFGRGRVPVVSVDPLRAPAYAA